jgi:hypothetical protein
MADVKILSRSGGSYTYMGTEDGKTRIGTVTDVTGVIRDVQGRRGMGAEKQAFGIHEASIPITTLDAWAKRISNGSLNAFDVADDEKLFERFMADHPCFKVNEGWQ